METSIAPRASIFRLVRSLGTEIRTFIRQEFDLVKTEVLEKISIAGKNAASLAIGGFVAYAGLIIFLFGLGWLAAFGLEAAGMDPRLATFLGLSAVGILVAGVGGILVAKSLKAFSKETLTPKRTIHTLQELRSGHLPTPTQENGHKLSSAEIEMQVQTTEREMGQTLDELGRRFSPSHINQQMKQGIQARPYCAGLVAMGVGLLGGFFVSHKFRRV